MGRVSMSWKTLALAVAVAIPMPLTTAAANAKAAKTDGTAAGSDTAPSKEDQAKLKEHNKLRAEIARVKYPASKAEVVSHVRGIKVDDKKWFEETLPDRMYSSADEVMYALGWETTSPPSAPTK
jgi:hypothetical protein